MAKYMFEIRGREGVEPFENSAAYRGCIPHPIVGFWGDSILYCIFYDLEKRLGFFPTSDLPFFSTKITTTVIRIKMTNIGTDTCSRQIPKPWPLPEMWIVSVTNARKPLPTVKSNLAD